MAKTTEEIKDLLATPLFVEGQKSNYISIKEKGDITYIEYNCKNGAKRRLQNPEEFVQATAFLKLIIEYNYSPLNISVNESVQVGSSTKEADILVYNDKNNKILIVVECKEEGDGLEVALSIAKYVYQSWDRMDEFDLLCEKEDVKGIKLLDLMVETIEFE